MGKVEENKQQKESRLLETAFQLFTTKGIPKTSVSDIVKNAGVAKGTFYLYFQDKYDLANKLIAGKTRNLFDKAMAALEKETIPIPENRVIFLVDHILDQLQRESLLLRFINKNLSWGVFRSAVTRAQDNIAAESLYARVFGPAVNEWRDLDAMLYLIIELVGSSCYSVILEGDPMPLEQFKPPLYQSIRAIVRAFHCPPEA